MVDHEELSKLKQRHADLNLALHRKEEAEKKLLLLEDESARTEKKIREYELQRQELQASCAQEEHELARTTASIDQLLTHDEAYIKQRAALAILEKAFADIMYDQEAHRTAVRRQQETAQELKQYEKLHEEILLQPERQRRINERCLELKRLNRELELLRKQTEGFATVAERYAQHTARTEQLKAAQDELNMRKESRLQEKGRYSQQLNHFEKLKVEHDRQTIKMKELTQTAEDYQTLATALGKNGIQALLIEDAIPEIELEANDLLGRLTDNQTHIFLESLRDLKSGGTQETLDIKISDAAGIRPYELFSGGEAFRIDFALRIAISKLLARRAGTSLQTLIIDEGFGSQDEDGLSYIMDALYKIQHDFKKIIIVSHLPRLNDQFPVRFCVQKSPSGSSIRIVEQA
jgi:exonuclease SbcC